MLTYDVLLTKIINDARRARAAGKSEGVTLDIARDVNPDLLNPAELLLAAFGGCLLKNISKLVPKIRLAIKDVRVHVTGVRVDNPPRNASIRYWLVLTTEEAKERIERLIDYLHAYGAVYNTLIPSVDVMEEIVLERKGGKVEQMRAVVTKTQVSYGKETSDD